jgi:hypothetical protein
MNQHIHIHGMKLASGEDLSLFDKNQIINLFQCKTNDKIPSNILNALDLLECRVRKGEFSVTSDFFFMTYGNKRFQRSLGVRLLTDAEKNTLNKYIESSGSLNSKKTEKAKEQALKQYLFTAVAAKLSLSVSSIDQISFQQWQEFVKPLRTDNDRWNEDFMGPFQVAGVRDLGTCLANIHHDPQFIAILKVIRSDKNNLGHDMLTNPPEHIIQWVNAWRHYIESSGNYTVTVYITAFYRFKIYLEEIYHGKEIPSPIEFFSSRRTDSFIDWVEHQNFDGKDAAVSTVHQNVQFSHWFINMYLSEQDEDDNGNKITTAFPLLRNVQFEAFKDKYRRSDLKPGESTKESPPLWLRERLKDLLSESDFAWPKSISSEYSTFAVDSNGDFLWVPTNTFIYLIMLEIPVRKIQLIRSDSGEGDVIKYDRNTDQWIPNTSISANYWKNDPSVKVINRGIIRQHITDNNKEQNLVLYINSNKTQDKNTGFTEFSGYEIPWKHPEVIRLISELRSWQEKNNPCLTPVKASDVPDSVYPKTLNEAIAKGLPDRFFLFRSAREVRGSATRHMPPTERSIGLFWNAAMDELETRLRSEGLDIQLVLNRNEHGQAQEVLYTPHSLRVAGLTSLAEQGVPIEVLSKLVAGHKSILMTIYYIKHDYAHITDVLNEASHKVTLESQESFARWIKEGTWQQISKYAVFNNEESAQAVTNPKQIAINGIWNSTHLGLCPYGGTRCNDGGEVIRKTPIKYSPVAEKDCVNCRHIITGRPWLTELTVHGNKLILDIEKKVKQTSDANNERHKLNLEKRRVIASSEIPSRKLTTDLNKLNSVLEKLSVETDELVRSLHNTHNLIQKIREIPPLSTPLDGNSSESILAPSLLVGSESSFEFDYKESPNNFATLDYVVQASRIYVHDRNKDYERERDEIMNIVLLNNGLTPIMMLPLSDEEKCCVADEFAKLLVTRATGEQIMSLKEGRVTLQDLGFTPSLPNVINRMNITASSSKLVTLQEQE